MASRYVRTAVALLVAFAVASTALPAPAAAAPPAGWSESAYLDYPIEPQSGVSQLSVATSHDGHAIAAWQRYLPSISRMVVQYSLYSPGQGWGPVADELSGVGAAVQPDVAAAPNGSIMMVWVETYSSFPDEVLSRWWVPGEGFRNPEVVSGGATGNGSVPRVAFDAAGNAFAVWNEYEAGYTNVSANRYVPGQGWQPLRVTIDNLLGQAGNPALVVDGGGNAFAAWRQHDGTRFRMQAARFDSLSGWMAPTALDDGLGLVLSVSRIAVEPSGNAVAAWNQFNSSGGFAIYSRYAVGGGWGAPAALSSPYPGQVSQIDLVATPGGDFLASWKWSGPVGPVEARPVYAGGTLGTVVNLSTSPDLYEEHLRSAAFGDGRVLLTWLLQAGGAPSGKLMGAWWTAAGGFAPTERLDDSPFLPVGHEVAAGGSDRAILMWIDSSATSGTLWYRTYYTPDTTLPWITIDSPADGTVTTNATIVFSGRAEPGARVLIGGVQAVVAGNGAFSIALPLLPGDNRISIQASDAAGNFVLATMTVTFDDPVPALEAALAAAQAELAAALNALDELWRALNQTRADLNDTRAELNVTRDDLNATQAELETTQAELAEAQAALAAAEARLGAVEGDLVAARDEVNQTRADLAEAQADINKMRADLSATQADLAATKAEQAETNARLQAETDQAKADASFALLLAALGAVLGGAGVVAALVMGRRKEPPDE